MCSCKSNGVTRVREDEFATVKAGARAGPSAGLAATSGNYVVHAGTTDANAVVTRPNPHAFPATS